LEYLTRDFFIFLEDEIIELLQNPSKDIAHTSWMNAYTSWMNVHTFKIMISHFHPYFYVSSMNMHENIVINLMKIMSSTCSANQIINELKNLSESLAQFYVHIQQDVVIPKTGLRAVVQQRIHEECAHSALMSTSLLLQLT